MSDSALTQGNHASAIKGRPFRLLLAGSSVSVLGTRMTTIAFPMLVLWLTGSPVAAGWTAFAATAPSMLVYLPAGALVDRWPPRRVMLISEFGRGLAIATVSLALLLGRANLLLLIGAAVIEEILEVFSTLAERRYVSSLVGHEQASPALVRMEARTHVMVLAGRPLGGFLFALMPTLPFIADTFSFVISVTALIRIKSGQVIELIRSLKARIRHLPRSKGASSRQSVQTIADCQRSVSWMQLRDDMRDGVRWLRHDQFTRVTVILSAGTTLICQALIIVFLAYAHSRHLSSIMIGIALAASGLGGALGSILAARLPAPTRRSWTVIRILAWSASVVVLAISGGQSFVCLAFVMSVLGFTGALGNVELGTYLIQNAPKDMLARVTSIGRLLSFAACAAGPVLGGIIIQEYRIQDTALLLGVAIFSLSVISLFLPSARTHQSRMIQIVDITVTCAICPSCAYRTYRRGWIVLRGLVTITYRTASGIPVCLMICTVLVILPAWKLLDEVQRYLRTYQHKRLLAAGQWSDYSWRQDSCGSGPLLASGPVDEQPAHAQDSRIQLPIRSSVGYLFRLDAKTATEGTMRQNAADSHDGLVLAQFCSMVPLAGGEIGFDDATPRVVVAAVSTAGASNEFRDQKSDGSRSVGGDRGSADTIVGAKKPAQRVEKAASHLPGCPYQDTALLGLGNADHVEGNGTADAAAHCPGTQYQKVTDPDPVPLGARGCPDRAGHDAGSRREHLLSRWRDHRQRCKRHERVLRAVQVAGSHSPDPCPAALKTPPISRQEVHLRSEQYALDSPPPHLVYAGAAT